LLNVDPMWSDDIGTWDGKVEEGSGGMGRRVKRKTQQLIRENK
jgi:hypothetical protein